MLISGWDKTHFTHRPILLYNISIPLVGQFTMSHIFISYSRKDLDFAQKIVDALVENDLDT